MLRTSICIPALAMFFTACVTAEVDDVTAEVDDDTDDATTTPTTQARPSRDRAAS